MKLDKIDLNAPAFGEGAQKIVADETVVDPAASVVDPKDTVDEPEGESKVPYTRFKKFHDRAIEAEEAAERYRLEADELRNSRRLEPQTVTNQMDPEWVELMGNTDASKRAWELQQARENRMLEKAREEAIEAVRKEQYQESIKTENNLEVLDESFEDLEAEVGRTLTDPEQEAILDIVDKYTPKDRYGNYAGPIMEFDQAWEIYNLQQKANKAPITQSRNAVSNIIANPSSGEPSVNAEADKNFNPLDWNAWKKRIGSN